MKTNNDRALAAFLIAKNAIDDMLARFTQLSDEHFNVHPDGVHWGHVGDLSRYAEHLKEITDMAFHEGEFAD